MTLALQLGAIGYQSGHGISSDMQSELTRKTRTLYAPPIHKFTSLQQQSVINSKVIYVELEVSRSGRH